MATIYNDLLIATKLIKPPLRSGVVTRQHLIEILNKSLGSKLTLISAPAGFGKTTLVLSWIKQLSHPVSWVSLENQDSNPARFFTYLAAAISQTNPTLNEYLNEKISSQVSGTVENMVEILLHEIASITPFTIIVLDDYHEIVDQKIHDAMSYLLQNLPSNPESIPTMGCHFVLLTRNDPPFPISKWRIEDEVTEIRAVDLRFSLVETRQILSQNGNLCLSESEMKILSDRTEGWIAGLQLVAISLKSLDENKHSEYIHQIKGNNKLISDYLIDEVFSRLDTETQRFLLMTSILERMCGGLCDAVTQLSGCQEILQRLEKNNVLVIPLDNERGWYRYHQLFSDILVNKLVNDPDYSLSDLHSRAAIWFEQNGIIEDSIKHWMKIARYDEAARIVAELSPGMMSRGQYFILSNLIECFPDEAFQVYPWLNIYLAWAYTFISHESVEAWLLLAEKVLDKKHTKTIHTEKEIKEMHGDVATIRAVIAARKGDSARVAKFAPIALKLLPKDKKKVRGLVLYSTATDQYISNAFDEAIISYEEAYNLLLQDRNLAGCLIVALKKIEILISQGKLHLAEISLRQAISLDLFYPGHELSMSGCLCVVYGKLLAEWNQLASAEEYLQMGMEKGKRDGISERVFIAATAADVWLSIGEVDKARSILAEYTELIGNQSITLWDESHLIASWMILLAVQGKKRDYAIISRKYCDVDQANIDIIREPIYFAQAYSAYLLGDYEKAIQIAQVLLCRMTSGNRNGSMVKILAMLASSRLAVGEVNSALTDCSTCLQQGVKEGYLHSYLLFGEQMMTLIGLLVKSDHLIRDNLDLNYINEIVEVFRSSKNIQNSSGKLESVSNNGFDYVNNVILTDHEKRVLRLLVTGYDNKEISRELCVSVNTVKKHISNIYGKLNVHNRFQVAVKVKQMGISLNP